ncbi:MAG TPA: DUF5683 domain-containing protein [Bacteroidota bacterium]|nr:DUF5683 domain-containing protein [Bacteroidota bacterium]
MKPAFLFHTLFFCFLAFPILARTQETWTKAPDINPPNLPQVEKAELNVGRKNMEGAFSSASQEPSQQEEWTKRKITAVILSALIPGSGQTYLGHTEKGAALTIGTFGSALIAGLSENNVVGRNERLDELKAQYLIAPNYVTADQVWNQMVETKSILDREARRRDLFLKIAIGLWVANMVDIILFTDDRGEKPFGARATEPRATVALVPDLREGIQAVLTVRF